MLWLMKIVSVSIVTAIVFGLAVSFPIIAGKLGKPEAAGAAPISRAASDKLVERLAVRSTSSVLQP